MSDSSLSSAEHLERVREYYGKVLSANTDLKTSACCSPNGVSASQKEILLNIEEEVLSKFYGCGTPIPPALSGCTVLDLGCGTGRDAYLLSKLVGEQGSVIGVDMTDEQLEVARRHIDTQTQRFGFKEPNVDFRKGFIEDLSAAGIADNSIDVVVSNCVINLSPDKERVFSEIFRVLKPGGELYFADVFASRRVPDELKGDPVLAGECLSGALYIEDFRRTLERLGCPDYRVFERHLIELHDPEVNSKIGMINFCSLTVRAFKLSSLEDRCEDYGQSAVYLGGIEDNPHSFLLDDHHLFEIHRPKAVCGNTALMLEETRFKNFFKISGDRSRHFGLFDCSESIPSGKNEIEASCC